MTRPSQNFWDFSTTLYAQDGVASACLFLQDHLGLDVNLLLFCGWYGQEFGILDKPTLEPLLQFSNSWKINVVEPQRNARRWMKEQAVPPGAEPDLYETLRDRIKLNELAAEKYQQETLQRMVDDATSRQEPTQPLHEAFRANLRVLLRACNVEPDPMGEEKLELLIRQSAA